MGGGGWGGAVKGNVKVKREMKEIKKKKTVIYENKSNNKGGSGFLLGVLGFLDAMT